mmetsp:Transcript_26568/g.88074  ORF Transcript_26568/g.88074 Transcript_26568/m.88074 type:complete len:84 (-) Transcript_26568:541-792(-)
MTTHAALQQHHRRELVVSFRGVANGRQRTVAVGLTKRSYHIGEVEVQNFDPLLMLRVFDCLCMVERMYLDIMMEAGMFEKSQM